jgi:hypothetical protein
MRLGTNNEQGSVRHRRRAQILRWLQQTLSLRMRGFGRFAAISSTQHSGRVVKGAGNAGAVSS